MKQDDIETKPAQTLSPQPENTNRTATTDFKKAALFILIAGLIVSALISVTAVLIGSFNEYLARALGMTISVVIHTLIVLAITNIPASKENPYQQRLVYVATGIVIASLATSVLSIWQIISGQLTGDLYILFVYTVIASLLIYMFATVSRNLLDKSTRTASLVAISLTTILYVLLLPTIFINYPMQVPEILWRLIAATAILLTTSGLIAAITKSLYEHKHPELKSPGSLPAWVVLIIIVAVTFSAGPFLLMFIGLAMNSMY